MPRPGAGPPTPQQGGAAPADEGGTPLDAPAPATVADPGARFDVSAFRTESGVDAALSRLDRELIGLEPVKRRLSEIAALLLVHRLRERFGLVTARPNLHMCFTGPPGTGKTTVATRVGEILHQLGFLPSPHIVTVGREELVGQYVGHTAPKTKEVLKRAMGGVLFIDEAYALHRRDNERDYGQEAIEILLQVMEDRRDDLVVVLAGYRDLMDTFFATNPGLRSRIAHHIDFPDFSDDELVEIGHRMLEEQGYRLTPDAEATFRTYVERRRAQPHFANARSVRNAVERARLRHAARIVAGGTDVGLDDLTQIEPDDLLRSAVFRTT